MAFRAGIITTNGKKDPRNSDGVSSPAGSLPLSSGRVPPTKLSLDLKDCGTLCFCRGNNNVLYLVHLVIKTRSRWIYILQQALCERSRLAIPATSLVPERNVILVFVMVLLLAFVLAHINKTSGTWGPHLLSR